MLVPLGWLKELVPYEIGVPELSALLTGAGLEVDGVVERHQGLENVVVARVTAVDPHPGADKLRLATVDFGGGEKLTVVCGAPNVRAGILSPLAREGAVLGGITVKKARIRGVESRGMLCSERELGFSEDHGGIMELPEGLTLGAPVVEALGLETRVLEISITPNRGDCLSIMGVAREVAAGLDLPLSAPAVDCPESGAPVEAQAKVVVLDPKGCPRYTARLVRNVKIYKSPLWMRDRLMACGVRPISNVVDITNYVLMELGQPLHAFDFAQVAGAEIRVRPAAEGELFTTLDNNERKLLEGMLLICDAERPVGLAGVMGGLNSEITDATQDVLIESAFFDPLNTRRTAKRLGLSTEASYRFERGVDVSGCALANSRAAKLMAELAGGEVAPGIIDEYPTAYEAPRLSLSVKRVSEFLGVDLARDEVTGPLMRLGLKLEDTGDPDLVTALPPAHRTDLERPVDLAEEVARMKGFDNIPARQPLARTSTRPRARNQALREKARDIMVSLGLNEAINYSFDHPSSVDRMQFEADDPRRRVVALTNPLAEDQSVLRTSLIPGLLNSVRHNLSHRVEVVALFEVGKVFWKREQSPQPQEPARLTAALAGLARPVSWRHGAEEVGFPHIRGVLEGLCEALGLSPVLAEPPEAPPHLAPGECLMVYYGDRLLAELGRVDDGVAEAFGVKRPVYLLDIDFDLLVEAVPETPSYRKLPRYPAVERDVAIVVDEAVRAGRLLEEAEKSGGKWLVEVRMFDLYRGKPLSKGQKSLGIRLTYRDAERTLTEEEVNPVHDRLVDHLLETFKGEQRT